MASIEKRGDNSWRVKVCRTDPFTKKVIVRRITIHGDYKGKTDKALLKLVNKFESDIDSGKIGYLNNDMTFYSFVKTYFDEVASAELSAKTIKGYKEHLNLHILPYLGKMRVRDVTPIIIGKYYTVLSNMKRADDKDYLSDKTIKNIIQVLSRMLTQAIYWQLIDTNPCSNVKKPKSKGIKREIRYYDIENVKALMTHLDKLENENLKWKTAIYLVLYMGYRRGEVAGLKDSDINFDNQTVILSRSRIYVAGEGIIVKSTKTNISSSKNAMPMALSTILSEYIDYKKRLSAELDELWQGSEYLLVNEYGQALHPESLSTWFTRFITKNNLPPLSFHQLRHTHATILLESGVAMKTIQDRLNHTRYQTTADIYSHVVKSVDREVADQLDDLFLEKEKIFDLL